MSKFITKRRFLKRTAGFTLGACGLFLPNRKLLIAATGTAYMTNSTFGGKAQSVLNEVEIKRKFLALGGAFTKLRVGIRCSVNGSSIPSNACGSNSGALFIGAQSGTSTGFFSAAPTNGLCAKQICGSWAFAGSGTTARYEPLSWAPLASTNGVETGGSAWGTLGAIPANSNSGAPAMVMVQINTGSPNWVITCCMPAKDGTPAAMDHSTFVSLMTGPDSGFTSPPSGYAYMNSPSGSFAFSQAAGTIDTATYGWIGATPLEVIDFMVTYSP